MRLLHSIGAELSYRCRDPAWLAERGEQSRVALSVLTSDKRALFQLSDHTTDITTKFKARPVARIDETPYQLGPSETSHLSQLDEVSRVRRYTAFMDAAQHLNPYVEALNRADSSYTIDLDPPPIPRQSSFELAATTGDTSTASLDNTYVSELEQILRL